MGRFLLNGLPISLIYRHLKAKSGSLCCSTIPFAPHILHKHISGISSRAHTHRSLTLEFLEMVKSVSSCVLLMEKKALFLSVNGVIAVRNLSLMHFWCANAFWQWGISRHARNTHLAINRLRVTFQQWKVVSRSFQRVIVKHLSGGSGVSHLELNANKAECREVCCQRNFFRLSTENNWKWKAGRRVMGAVFGR